MIEINNLTNFAVDKTFFMGVAKKVLKGENRGTENLSIAFVIKKEMQRLNKTCRGIDKPTDVLSFSKVLHFKEDVSEVIICPEVVKSKSESSKINLKIELSKVLIHGILHTLGYDHEMSNSQEVRMFKKEALYFSKLWPKVKS